LCKWTNDAQRFLLEHFDTIHNSPSQIYHSALPFCPSSSWLHKCYDVELLDEVKIVKGLPAEWGTCSRTVVLEHRLLAISYWNNTVAVGTTHWSIVILDTITGSQVGVLSGHNDWVESITFSSDGVFLVSGSDDKTCHELKFCSPRSHNFAMRFAT
jgi:WD40 repeat protein